VVICLFADRTWKCSSCHDDRTRDIHIAETFRLRHPADIRICTCPAPRHITMNKSRTSSCVVICIYSHIYVQYKQSPCSAAADHRRVQHIPPIYCALGFCSLSTMSACMLHGSWGRREAAPTHCHSPSRNTCVCRLCGPRNLGHVSHLLARPPAARNGSATSHGA
jgi:hypothetical protein